jgi:hydroxypyruvate reductase
MPAGRRDAHRNPPTRSSPLKSDPRHLLLEAYRSALVAVGGRDRVCRRLEGANFPDGVYVVALGKAACAMAEGAHDALGGQIRDALVITKRGYAQPLPWPVLEAGHPRPDAGSIDAGHALLAFIDRLPEAAEMLVLLSGGASALAEVLPDGVDLDALQRVNDWLLGSGLDIAAMNRIRKRLSLIKGGRLAQRLAPRRTLCLAISDVPGDDPRAIGSGPLTADDSPGEVALPPWLAELLRAAPSLPARGDACFERVSYEIIAGNRAAVAAAVAAVERLGMAAVAEPEFITGDAATVGARLAQSLHAAAPATVHVWGGETTVRLPPRPGRGGRCQQLALAAALGLNGSTDIWLLAAGTDGSDGPTEDAGALVDGGTVARGALSGMEAGAALRAADAGSFLEASGDLVQTGPTGTNVMDLMLGLRSR